MCRDGEGGAFKRLERGGWQGDLLKNLLKSFRSLLLGKGKSIFFLDSLVGYEMASRKGTYWMTG